MRLHSQAPTTCLQKRFRMNSNYTISSEFQKLDFDVIHHFIANSYWAMGRTKSDIEKAAKHSLNFGIYLGDNQVGYARAITDYTTFAYYADVFILAEHQGSGLGKALVKAAMEHPEMTTVNWYLRTEDAHELYAQFGFEALPRAECYMRKGKLR
jgi:GNAT superfamily N-acetyltransferase